MAVEWWVWAAFVGGLLVVLALDLLVFHAEAHAVSLREAAAWSVLWVVLGLLFGGLVWLWQGTDAAGAYLAGYLIEKSLSVDNIFVFALIFQAFAVPAALQHRALFWGVLGAIVFRAIFILVGAALLERFHWVIYLFGAFLVITGIRMALERGGEVDPAHNPALGLLRRVLPVSTKYHGARLLVAEAGRRVATPLLAVLVVIGTTDIVFAVDSIPAVFAVTSDPFLVFTSNAFAILGLQAMYFLLAGLMNRFVYLKVGLGAILVLAGAKMLTADLVSVPVWLSLGLIGLILAVTAAVSLLATSGARSARRV